MRHRRSNIKTLFDRLNEPGSRYRGERTFNTFVCAAVQDEFGESRCPCCASPMVRPRRRNGAAHRRRDRVTVAHDRPVSLGGDSRIWVYACSGCNQEQGVMTFRTWGMELARRGDPRAPRVLRLADVIAEAVERLRRAA